jgi:hypothetical protein
MADHTRVAEYPDPMPERGGCDPSRVAQVEIVLTDRAERSSA